MRWANTGGKMSNLKFWRFVRLRFVQHADGARVQMLNCHQQWPDLPPAKAIGLLLHKAS
jgi:hypothetical protein